MRGKESIDESLAVRVLTNGAPAAAPTPAACSEGTCAAYSYKIIIRAPSWQCTDPGNSPTGGSGSGGWLYWEASHEGPSGPDGYNGSVPDTTNYFEAGWGIESHVVCRPYDSKLTVSVSSANGIQRTIVTVNELGELLELPSITEPDTANNNMWALSEMVAMQMEGMLSKSDPP